jgi:hypothetical protein
MEKVTVRKEDLVKAVQANRDEHRSIFEEAVAGYRKRGIELLEEHIARIKTGKLEQIRVTMPVPQDHTHDYDRVLKMLNMSTADEIELDENRFAQYVMDDWQWQRQFLTDSSAFSASALGKLDRM